MAEPGFHFAAGMMIGTTVFLPALVARFRSGARMSAFFLRWIVAAFGAAIFAVFPSVLTTLGMPERFLTAWWMNVFVLFPFLNSVKRGGFIVGTAVILACFGLIYLSLLVAARKRSEERGLKSEDRRQRED